MEIVECPYCSEVQSKEMPYGGTTYQFVCVECEDEFEVYKTKSGAVMGIAHMIS